MQQVPDPVRPLAVSLRTDEIEYLKAEMEAGNLPRDYLERCDRAREENTFGVGFRRDSKGNPIEMGIGSPGNLSVNHVGAYEKYCKHEPNYERTLAKMRQDLAAQQDARRKAAGK